MTKYLKRNEELSKLYISDIIFNCKGPTPYKVKHFWIVISGRKGWQKKVDQSRSDLLHTICLNITIFDLNIPGALLFSVNKYGIYDQPDKPVINCFRVMLVYLTFLELHIYSRPLQPTDYIFPAIGSNDVVQPGEHVSLSTVQGWLDNTLSILNVKLLPGARFSPHCFQRGGAQYWFMHAPIGERWTLDQICW